MREFNEGTKQNPRLFLSVFSSCWFLILTLGCPLESTEELKKYKKKYKIPRLYPPKIRLNYLGSGLGVWIWGTSGDSDLQLKLRAPSLEEQLKMN